MNKRIRKKMWTKGNIKHSSLFVDLRKEISTGEGGVIYFPTGRYYSNEGKIYKFK